MLSKRVFEPAISCVTNQYVTTTTKTRVAERIFQLTSIDASVIYQIPWTQWIQWILFGNNSFNPDLDFLDNGSPKYNVTCITIVLDLWCGQPRVRSTEAFRLLSQGVTAEVHRFTVHALGHNLGKVRAFTNGPLHWGVQSTRKYTRLHAWTLYCTPLRWYKIVPSNKRVESNSHYYSALVHSRLNRNTLQ